MELVSKTKNKRKKGVSFFRYPDLQIIFYVPSDPKLIKFHVSRNSLRICANLYRNKARRYFLQSWLTYRQRY